MTTYTRKHYIAIAERIADFAAIDERRDEMTRYALGACVDFERDNPRFDARRFLIACGLLDDAVAMLTARRDAVDNLIGMTLFDSDEYRSLVDTLHETEERLAALR